MGCLGFDCQRPVAGGCSVAGPYPPRRRESDQACVGILLRPAGFQVICQRRWQVRQRIDGSGLKHAYTWVVMASAMACRPARVSVTHPKSALKSRIAGVPIKAVAIRFWSSIPVSTRTPPTLMLPVSCSQRAAVARSRSRCIVVVEDNGPGIQAEDIDRIFERFYTDRPESEGFGQNSGLGLSISRQIAEAHGGTLKAENVVDQDGAVRGARFTLTLPAEQAA